MARPSPTAKLATSKVPNRPGTGKLPTSKVSGSNGRSSSHESAGRGRDSRGRGGPKKQDQTVLFASIGGGVLALVVIIALVMGGGRKPEPKKPAHTESEKTSTTNKPTEHDPFANEKRDPNWKPNTISDRANRAAEVAREKQREQEEANKQNQPK